MEHYPLRVKWGTLAAALAACALAGCSLDGSAKPKAAKGAPREAAAVIGRLEQASARGDWATVCGRLFSADARRRAGGRDCPRLVRADAGSLSRPRIDVLGIAVNGNRASVRVRSRAKGQPPLVDVIHLRRERGAFRIDSLAG